MPLELNCGNLSQYFFKAPTIWDCLLGRELLFEFNCGDLRGVICWKEII